tara:strand:- start:392 stop:610 length:219 start_codon:yes stop_codon:yes gene_type:complete
MLKAIIKPPIENPIIVYDIKLTSPRYSGVRYKNGTPYFSETIRVQMARMINHIPIRMGLFFIWTKINWTGKK